MNSTPTARPRGLLCAPPTIICASVSSDAKPRRTTANARGKTRLVPSLRRPFQKLHQCQAVRGGGDPLLRHFCSRCIDRWTELEQLRYRFRCPHDVEFFERLREIIAGQRGDAAAEEARQRWAGAAAFGALEGVASHAGAKNFRPGIAGERTERIIPATRYHLNGVACRRIPPT